jgi:aarF domain-containing kinase
MVMVLIALQVPMYNFASSQMAASVAKFGAVMLKERLTAPPTEAYTIHRKLSGAFVTAVKLQSQLPARHLFYLVAGLPEPPVPTTSAAPSSTATTVL